MVHKEGQNLRQSRKSFQEGQNLRQSRKSFFKLIFEAKLSSRKNFQVILKSNQVNPKKSVMGSEKLNNTE